MCVDYRQLYNCTIKNIPYLWLMICWMSWMVLIFSLRWTWGQVITKWGCINHTFQKKPLEHTKAFSSIWWCHSVLQMHPQASTSCRASYATKAMNILGFAKVNSALYLIRLENSFSLSSENYRVPSSILRLLALVQQHLTILSREFKIYIVLNLPYGFFSFRQSN